MLHTCRHKQPINQPLSSAYRIHWRNPVVPHQPHQQASSSMAIQFCDDCGDTLPTSVQKLVTCDCCGKENKSMYICRDGLKYQLTQSPDGILKDVINQSSSDFPSPLRSKLKDNIQQLTSQDHLNTRATIKRECPKCHAPEVTYVELQLRSADEGSTIMYTCLKCREKYASPFPSTCASY